jgi:hypothetical protein
MILEKKNQKRPACTTVPTDIPPRHHVAEHENPAIFMKNVLQSIAGPFLENPIVP